MGNIFFTKMQEEDIDCNFSLSFSNFDSLDVDIETSDNKQLQKELENQTVELSTTIHNKSNPTVLITNLENKNMPHGLFKSEICIANNHDLSNYKTKSDKGIENSKSPQKQIGSSISQIDAKSQSSLQNSDIIFESKIPNAILDDKGKLVSNSCKIAACCKDTKNSIKR